MPDIVTFDGVNKIIREIDVGGDNTLDIIEIYSEWKEWVKLSNNSGFFRAFSVVGGDPITAELNLGSTFFLENGWRIQPAEADHKLTLVGNIFTREEGQSVFIPTDGAFTVNTETRVSNLVDAAVSRLDLVQLLNAVYIDTFNGVSGTDKGTGTPTSPVNNVTDARAIADRDNLSRYVIRGNITLDDSNYSDWDFQGSASETATSIDINGRNVHRSRFENCLVKGTLEQNSRIECDECSLDIVNELNGVFRNCALQNDFVLQGNGTASFSDCFSETIDNAVLVCDFNGANNVNFKNYSGILEIKNLSNGDFASIDLDPGHLVLGNTNVGGSLILRGLGQYTDNMGTPNTSVDKTGLIERASEGTSLTATDVDNISSNSANKVWDYLDTQLNEKTLAILRDKSTRDDVVKAILNFVE